MKMLADTKPGEVVKVWAQVRDLGSLAVPVWGGDGCEVLALHSDCMVEELVQSEPWPGEVAGAFVADAEARFEWALYGETAETA
jgi:hypothetical protein